jgi:formiminoglutamase
MSDPRLGDLIGRDLAQGPPRVVLLGFPTDAGVRRNGGRFGASGGPREIRAWLRRLTPDPERRDAFGALLGRTEDRGDVAVSEDLEADQERLGEAVAGVLRAGAFPIVLGGGHETAYGHFLGYAKAGRAVDLLNMDAHPDVRELKDGKGHSGSPFRQALEHPSGLARRYVVAGLLPWSTAAEHLSFVRSRGATVFRSDLTEARLDALFGALAAPSLASFDIDAVEGASAPGASAPSTGGLPVGLWLHAARLAGRTASVASFDVCETNPRFDVDGRTARLAAATVWSVLAGLCERAG